MVLSRTLIMRIEEKGYKTHREAEESGHELLGGRKKQARYDPLHMNSKNNTGIYKNKKMGIIHTIYNQTHSSSMVIILNVRLKMS